MSVLGRRHERKTESLLEEYRKINCKPKQF